jgi:hypothetical protein
VFFTIAIWIFSSSISDTSLVEILMKQLEWFRRLKIFPT